MFFQGLQEFDKGQGDQVPNVLSITKRAPSMVKVACPRLAPDTPGGEGFY